MTTDDLDRGQLCYLDAASVKGPFPTCDGVGVWNDEDGMIGQLDGIVLNPESRQIRISSSRPARRSGVIATCFRSVTRVDVQHYAFCVDAHKSDLARCE